MQWCSKLDSVSLPFDVIIVLLLLFTNLHCSQKPYCRHPILSHVLTTISFHSCCWRKNLGRRKLPGVEELLVAARLYGWRRSIRLDGDQPVQHINIVIIANDVKYKLRPGMQDSACHHVFAAFYPHFWHIQNTPFLCFFIYLYSYSGLLNVLSALTSYPTWSCWFALRNEKMVFAFFFDVLLEYNSYFYFLPSVCNNWGQ